jgi:hypothetical protein
VIRCSARDLGVGEEDSAQHASSLREAFEMEGPLPPLIEEDKEDARTCEVCPSAESSLIVLICAVAVDCGVNV